MKKVTTVTFKVDSSFISERVFDMFVHEGKDYKACEKLILEVFTGMPAEEGKQLTKDIILGKKGLKGIYPDEAITIVDVDREEEFNKQYMRGKITIPDEMADVIKEKLDVIYASLPERLLTDLPSYKCRYENHTMDNSFIGVLNKSLEEIGSLERARNIKFIGVCKNPEFQRNERYGIVYEDQIDFKIEWCHISDFIIDMLYEKIKGEVQ